MGRYSNTSEGGRKGGREGGGDGFHRYFWYLARSLQTRVFDEKHIIDVTASVEVSFTWCDGCNTRWNFAFSCLHQVWRVPLTGIYSYLVRYSSSCTGVLERQYISGNGINT